MYLQISLSPSNKKKEITLAECAAVPTLVVLKKPAQWHQALGIRGIRYTLPSALKNKLVTFNSIGHFPNLVYSVPGPWLLGENKMAAFSRSCCFRPSLFLSSRLLECNHIQGNAFSSS